jgi:hypothetical protein
LYCPISLTKNLKVKIHLSTVVPGVLYACKTWPYILSEAQKIEAVGEQMAK